ncbi:MAG: VF530 family protein [Bdellovibrionia bacterium]
MSKNSEADEGKQPNNPFHNVTLEMMLTQLVEHYGWDEMGSMINIKCFNYDPSIKSSLVFLRRTPWARSKVEDLYLTYKSETSESAK